MTKRTTRSSKAAAAIPVFNQHTAEPAHSIIQTCGGVRSLARGLGVSAAAVTRWQKAHTATDKRGCDGVIPEFRRAAVIAFARSRRRRVTWAQFLKASE